MMGWYHGGTGWGGWIVMTRVMLRSGCWWTSRSRRSSGESPRAAGRSSGPAAASREHERGGGSRRRRLLTAASEVRGTRNTVQHGAKGTTPAKKVVRTDPVVS